MTDTFPIDLPIDTSRRLPPKVIMVKPGYCYCQGAVPKTNPITNTSTCILCGGILDTDTLIPTTKAKTKKKEK